MSSFHRTEMNIAFAVFVGWAMLLMGLSFGKMISCDNFDTACKKGIKEHNEEEIRAFSNSKLLIKA